MSFGSAPYREIDDPVAKGYPASALVVIEWVGDSGEEDEEDSGQGAP